MNDVSILPLAEFGSNDHREDTPHFSYPRKLSSSKFSRTSFSKKKICIKKSVSAKFQMVRWDSPENAFKVPPNWRRAQEEIEKELLQQRRKVSHQPQTQPGLPDPSRINQGKF